MDNNSREYLIRGLQAEFNKNNFQAERLSPSNYIANTGSLDCSLTSISSEDLMETISVIKTHKAKFAPEALKSTEAMTNARHLEIAKRAIEKIIALRSQGYEV